MYYAEVVNGTIIKLFYIDLEKYIYLCEQYSFVEYRDR